MKFLKKEKSLYSKIMKILHVIQFFFESKMLELKVIIRQAELKILVHKTTANNQAYLIQTLKMKTLLLTQQKISNTKTT